MYRLSFLLLLTFVACGSVAHAQFLNSDPLSITISPNYPRPNEVVQVTVGSTLIDLGSAQTTITVNGKTLTTYTGTETIPVSVGASGQVTTIAANVKFGGKTYKKSLSVTPSDVALVLEPISTSHPFYEGGLGLASQGRLRAVAIPDLRNSKGVRLDPKTLVYTWKFGTQVLQANSGIGKNVLDATAPQRYRENALSVTVTSPDSSLVASASTVLAPIDPIVRLYSYDPLMGTNYANAVSGTYAMQDAEDSFQGVPYYFAAVPTFAWSVNGSGSGGDPIVTVRSTGSGGGRANLSLAARVAELHQNVTANLSIIFGNTSKTNIFGF